MMMILARFNSIAARIAIAIILAIILGLVMAFSLNVGLNWYASRQEPSSQASNTYIVVAVMAHRNLVMLSGEIVMTIRAVAAVPQPERQRLIAAFRQPTMADTRHRCRIALEEPAPVDNREPAAPRL